MAATTEVVGEPTQPAQLRSLEVVVTSGCNLACGYCYQRNRPARRMDWSTLQEGLDLLLASGQSEMAIGFCGGEPLLEFPTVRRAVDYAERRLRPGQRIRYSLITNGVLLGSEAADFLATHRFNTQLSFDGIAAAQDRRQRGSFGALDGLLDRLRRDHSTFFEDCLTISLTVLPSTLDCLPASIDYFHGKAVRDIVLSPLLTDSSDWRPERLPELKVAWLALADSSVEHYRETERIPLAPLRRQVGDPLRRRPVCTLGRFRTLAIDTDGEAYGCVLFSESLQDFPSDFLRRRIRTLRLGRLSASEFADRLAAYPAAVSAAGIFDHQEEKYSSYGRCRDCDYLSTCEICPLAIGHIPGNADPNRIPDFLCAFNLAINHARQRFQRRVAKHCTATALATALDTLRRTRRRLELRAADLRSVGDR